MTQAFNLSQFANNLNSSGQTSTAGIQDGNVTPAKLSTGAPTWDASGNVTVTGAIKSSGGANISGGAWGVIPYVSNSLVVDNNAGQSRFFLTGDASNYGTAIWYGGKTSGATTTYMSLDTNGLGVGGTRSSVKLYAQAAGQRVIEFSDNSNYSIGMGYSPAGGTYGWIGGTGGSGLSLGANNSENIRIPTSGQMSTTDVAGNLKPAFGCRAYVNFNGTGTVAIRGSGNVSSITDNGTGNYTINFSTAISDANYAAAGMCYTANNNFGYHVEMLSMTASALQILSDQEGGGAAAYDNSTIMVIVTR